MGRRLDPSGFEHDRAASGLVIQHRGSVLEAINESNTGLAGFAGRLIAAMNHEIGCDFTLTFDKDAAGSDGFKELET